MGIRNKSKTKKYKSVPYNGDRNVDQADCMKRLWGKVHNIHIQIWNENVIFHRFILVLSYLRLTINIFFCLITWRKQKPRWNCQPEGRQAAAARAQHSLTITAPIILSLPSIPPKLGGGKRLW